METQWSQGPALQCCARVTYPVIIAEASWGEEKAPASSVFYPYPSQRVMLSCPPPHGTALIAGNVPLCHIHKLLWQNTNREHSKDDENAHYIVAPYTCISAFLQLHRRRSNNVWPEGTLSGTKHPARNFSNGTIFKLSCQFAFSLGDYHQNNYANCLISALCSASKERFLHTFFSSPPPPKFKAVIMLNKWPWLWRLLLNAPKREGLEDGHVAA